MKRYDIVIGIDPDVSKSGVSSLDVKTRHIDAETQTFPQLMEFLQFIVENGKVMVQSYVVVVEAGWLNEISNYHTKADRAGQRISKNVGANHEVGKKIVEMAKHYGLEVVEQKPLKKCWKGKDGKITHAELEYFTGITGSTNQESRDAALLAWNYANLPIKLKAENFFKI